jgi:hypothetical protein
LDETAQGQKKKKVAMGSEYAGKFKLLFFVVSVQLLLQTFFFPLHSHPPCKNRALCAGTLLLIGAIPVV